MKKDELETLQSHYAQAVADRTEQEHKIAWLKEVIRKQDLALGNSIGYCFEMAALWQKVGMSSNAYQCKEWGRAILEMWSKREWGPSVGATLRRLQPHIINDPVITRALAEMFGEVAATPAAEG